jgi:uncharacterized damage-inducible protein DinB
MFRLLLVLAVVLPLATFARSEERPQDASFMNELQMHIGSVTRNVVAAAELMPESEYAWKPANAVRTFGEVIGHITDASRYFCATIDGKGGTFSPEWERSGAGKAATVAELKKVFGRCTEAIGALTDETTSTRVTIEGGQLIDGRNLPTLGLTSGFVAALHASHTNEHYGNLATYLRLKGLVPPTSQR